MTLTISANYKQFIDTLKQQKNCLAEFATDLATRLTMATDSSIYQVLPEAVCFPKSHRDVQTMMQLAAQPQFHNIQFSPRGGGTGTNGQSLTLGIMIDFSRHMNQILEIDPVKKMARVQPGVVLDQLNAAAQPHGLFFAPMISTSTRATIGGMFATDASGKGSCYYGQTGDHILSTLVVLANGQEATIDKEIHNPCTQQKNKMLQLRQTISDLIQQNDTAITQRFSHLPRHLNGYNLGKYRSSGNLNDLLAGSEGTLAITTELTVNLVKKPNHQLLFILKYPHFDAALRHARQLTALNPTAIETIDDTILQAETSHIINKNDDTTKAINLVELQHTDLNTLNIQKKNLLTIIEKEKIAYFCFEEEKKINQAWAIRKKCVGILANLPGDRQPIPFVEDTAVPPEHLADFIVEFRALLDKHQLTYGMFGHADAGCIHVRPALNLKNETDAALIPIITQGVYALIKKYKGLMWGEHGRGYRSVQTEDFFGHTLYKVLQSIKTLFDPYNQLNPGKVVSALSTSQPIVTLTQDLRAIHDQKISPNYLAHFEKSIRCNGNGACFHYNHDAIICPTFHATQDRIHSPKGRATLLRAWAMAQSQNKHTDTFNQLTKNALSTCVGCKACKKDCPVHINIPKQKATFLSAYYQQHRRPLADFLIIYSESLSKWIRQFPRTNNVIVNSGILNILGLKHLPKADSHAKKILSSLLKEKRETSAQRILLIADAFTATYQPSLIQSYYQLLTSLEYTVTLAPIMPIGKPAHAKGALDYFEKSAKKMIETLHSAAENHDYLIGIDPAFTLCFRDEYVTQFNQPLSFHVVLINEFLKSDHFHRVKDQCGHHIATKENTYYLFSHCHEKSLVPNSDLMWKALFKAAGLTLILVQSSCCGMAGSFGHESNHAALAEKCFNTSMKLHIDTIKDKAKILTTGFSCRCQIQQLAKFITKHPVEVLLSLTKGTTT